MLSLRGLAFTLTHADWMSINYLCRRGRTGRAELPAEEEVAVHGAAKDAGRIRGGGWCGNIRGLLKPPVEIEHVLPPPSIIISMI